MGKHSERFTPGETLLFATVTLAVLLLCVFAGSVQISPLAAAHLLWNAICDKLTPPQQAAHAILFSVRLPRVLNVALTGASLSVCGAAMQGLLRNPLADGSTLGVASGASLGAVLAIAFGVTIPGLPFSSIGIMAALFAFLSFLMILLLAYRLDYSLSTNTIILIGVIYSMFISSILSLIITIAPDRLKHITFWTMGSLSGSTYSDALLLAVSFIVFGGILHFTARELNAFAVGEENARHIGVNVRRTKLLVMFAASALIGMCVSVGGTIGFVGLVTPHMTRMIVGPNHKRLLPASAFSGATFLMLSDLAARVVLAPRELPIGVVTSLVGALLFIYIFYTTGRHGHA